MSGFACGVQRLIRIRRLQRDRDLRKLEEFHELIAASGASNANGASGANATETASGCQEFCFRVGFKERPQLLHGRAPSSGEGGAHETINPLEEGQLPAQSTTDTTTTTDATTSLTSNSASDSASTGASTTCGASHQLKPPVLVFNNTRHLAFHSFNFVTWLILAFMPAYHVWAPLNLLTVFAVVSLIFFLLVRLKRLNIGILFIYIVYLVYVNVNIQISAKFPG